MKVQLPLELKALGWAILAAVLSLAGAGLLAGLIQITSAASPATASASAAGAAPKIAASPEVVEQGRQFFAMSCTQCHGDDAHGDEGPDLHNLSISNARIAATIKKGIKGEMPTFTKKYDDRQIAVLVSYLRTLH